MGVSIFPCFLQCVRSMSLEFPHLTAFLSKSMHVNAGHKSPRIIHPINEQGTLKGLLMRNQSSRKTRGWVLDVPHLYLIYLLSGTKYFVSEGQGSENLSTVDPLGTELNKMKTAAIKSQVQQCTPAMLELLQDRRGGQENFRGLQAREDGV